MEDELNRIVHGDNLEALRPMETGSVGADLYRSALQHRPQADAARMKTVQDEAGDRVGFGGRRYRTELVARSRRPEEECRIR